MPSNNYVKKSYGIACCRFNKLKEIEILLVKKRYTYSFVMFVLGKYNKKNDEFLVSLFNGMTNQEKTEILSLRFEIIWYKVWLNIPNLNYTMASIKEEKKGKERLWKLLFDKHVDLLCGLSGFGTVNFYIKKKNKFETAFLSDGGKRLRRLIHNSKNCRTLWEIPKGKRNKRESVINCSIREFKEETGMSENNYVILFNLEPLVFEHSNYSCTYINKYHIAYSLENKELNRFNSYNQSAEVCDMKWVTLEQASFMEGSSVLKSRVSEVFKRLKSKYSYKK